MMGQISRYCKNKNLQYQLEKIRSQTQEPTIGDFDDKIIVDRNEAELTYLFVNQGSLVGSLPSGPRVPSFRPIYS